jgi:transcriptional regulator with XRE-family HTH domain
VSDLLNTTGKRIQRLRKDLDLTQTEVARQMAKRGTKINPSYLSMIEGSNKVPSGEVLRGLAQVLQTTTDYLLQLTDDPLVPGALDEDARDVSDHEWELVTALRGLPDPDRLTLYEMVKELIGVAAVSDSGQDVQSWS